MKTIEAFEVKGKIFTNKKEALNYEAETKLIDLINDDLNDDIRIALKYDGGNAKSVIKFLKENSTEVSEFLGTL